MNEPFRFTLAPAYRSASGEELWDATVRPDGVSDSLPPAFQLRLAPPGRSAPRRTALRAVIRRGDWRGTTWMLVMLGGTFGPKPTSQSGALIPITTVQSDSIPLALTVGRHSEDGWWTALATLPNGGHFTIAIDSASSRGEFRSVGTGDNEKVLIGLAALIAPRP